MSILHRHQHERPHLHQSVAGRVHVGSLISHPQHITPLIMTRERSADGTRRLAVSLGGNTEWIGLKEKVDVFARSSSQNLVLVGSGLNGSARREMLEKKKPARRAARV